MYFPSRSEFKRITQKDSLVPVAKILPLEVQTIDWFERVVQEKYSFFLDSARFHSKIGRYSFMGFNPFIIFKSKNYGIEVIKGAVREFYETNPINKLREIFSEFKSVKIDGLPDFCGGAVGYLSYDVGRLFEKLPQIAQDDLGPPDIYFAFYDTVIAFDHLENKTFIIANVISEGNLDRAYDEAIEKIERLHRQIQDARCMIQDKKIDITIAEKEVTIESNFSREGFEEIVRRAKEYIKKGDIYQANLSQRLSVKTDIEPFHLYKILREVNPSPFAAYLNFEEVKIVSSSPERLLKVKDGFVQTRPIAGTRPRGKDFEENLKLRQELILNEKERAEHIMLVDLERNDLGRVCGYGTVKVDEMMVLEEYSHVIHIVSNVSGKLYQGKDRFDLIRAAFPGGTITGCPKIRCMEIIEELEPVRRGIYCGSIGYLGFNGDMDLNIVIRTFILSGGKAYIQVGAGIVADSDPTREYFETLYKAQGLLEALKEAEKRVAGYKPQATGRYAV
jgi:anthranilate synthase component 1/para-aminobenzoate synthetase component 1